MIAKCYFFHHSWPEEGRDYRIKVFGLEGHEYVAPDSQSNYVLGYKRKVEQIKTCDILYTYYIICKKYVTKNVFFSKYAF